MCCQHKPVPMTCILLWLQMLRRATTWGEMRQLLIQQGLTADDVLAFDSTDVGILYQKGFRTPSMLARADMALLREAPPLPGVLIKAILESCNPGALPAGTGGWPRAADPDAQQQAACLTCCTA